ncbi:MAG: SDR family oxidoreductase [Desulfobacterales bacterium]|nr:SDR family oxidoreductase [Desulfobacterales bacterium]
MPETIFITGASSGIGRAVALEMAGRGYGLALAARRVDALEELQEEIRTRDIAVPVATRALDVTAYDRVFEVFGELADESGGIDIAFANAGIALGERVGRGEFARARQSVAVNLLGAMATIDAAAAYFLDKGGGHVVGVSSVAALRGMPKSSSYCASKAGIAVYLEALRAEALRKNIHVTVLYPGYIDTPLNNMLPNRPFLISVEKGSQIIADLIEKKAKSAFVPCWPWALMGRLLKILPTRVIARM